MNNIPSSSNSHLKAKSSLCNSRGFPKAETISTTRLTFPLGYNKTYILPKIYFEID
ncbi:unnamed protein product [Moneuplotes crassus]|uniref:Uncharacterized protein n=1 Tax=Euplotes crassus TaxID=5936 RepID=A0AAD1YA24_EUPCR|nr:unnamed protein product [Moneuplotes crassus]